MRMWIVCSGQAPQTWKKRCAPEEYAALCCAQLEGEIGPVDLKPIQTAGRPIFISAHPAARETAARLYPDGEPRVDPRLDELLPEAQPGGTPQPLWLLRWKARPRGARKTEAERRADSLIASLEETDEDCILISHPRFLGILLDRLRVHGYCITRGGLIRILPLERILITRRDMHCGGCGHNCYLSNPGCGIGKDKAARRSQ